MTPEVLIPLLLAAVLLLIILARGRESDVAETVSVTAAEPAPAMPTHLLAILPGMAYRCRFDGGFVYASEGAEGLTGYSPLELGGARLVDLVHPDDRALVHEEWQLARQERRPFQLTYRILTRHGEERWVWEKGRFQNADGGFIEGFVTDVTQRHDTVEKLRHDALHDRLTGLANRTLLMERLERAIQRVHRRSDCSFAVLMLDLDRFKVINDSLGHDRGNRVLRITARRLEACLRQEDTIARLGGDEFAILLDEIGDGSDAVRVAQRIFDLLGLPLYLAEEEIYTSASIGIALSVSGYHRAEELLRDAEIAMYRAKAAGGGRHELFDRTMHARAVERLRLETELRRALERSELELYYQPIVDLASGSIRGFEALLRWAHPQRGRLAPADFLPTAAETGLIVPFSWWALGQACRQLVAWQRAFPDLGKLFISVNLTNRQLDHPQLDRRILDILRQSSLDAASVQLEITESMVLDHAASVAALERIRDLGVKLALDDFGTGYSSLSSLSRLPIHGLKIDRSFIAGLDGNDGPEIVRTIISMAENLELEVVAEGVETPEQAERLRAMGCNRGQGFLFAHPLSEAKIEELLTREARWASTGDDLRQRA